MDGWGRGEVDGGLASLGVSSRTRSGMPSTPSHLKIHDPSHNQRQIEKRPTYLSMAFMGWI